MATNTELKINVTVVGTETATQRIKSLDEAVSKTASNVGDNMTNSFIKGGLAVNAITAAAKLGFEAIQKVGEIAVNAAKEGWDFATQLEQTALSFAVLTGSAETAKTTLKDLSDFSLRTPFTFEDLTLSSKKLLAYGVEAKELIPVLETLGNVAASVGVDKFPQLTLAYGQVKAATKLTGMELRQFTETGIPMLEMLADAFNGVSNSTKMGTKWTKEATKRNGELSKAYTTVVKKMADLEDKGEKGTELWYKYDSQANSLAEKMNALNKEFGNTGISIMDVQNKIRIGAVSFDMVTEAFRLASAEGGRYHDMMILQSKTVLGLGSNFEDLRKRFLAAMMGFDAATGDIIKGGVLDVVREKLAGLFQWFMDNEVAIRSTFTQIGLWAGNAINGIVATVQSFSNDALVRGFGALIAGLFPDTKQEQEAIVQGIKDIEKQIIISTPAMEAFKELIKGLFGGEETMGGQTWNERIKNNTDLAMESLGRVVIGIAKFAIAVVQAGVLIGAAFVQIGAELELLKVKASNFIWPTEGNAKMIESLQAVSDGATVVMEEMTTKLNEYSLEFNNDWTTAVNNVSGTGASTSSKFSTDFINGMNGQAQAITNSMKAPITTAANDILTTTSNAGVQAGANINSGINSYNSTIQTSIKSPFSSTLPSILQIGSNSGSGYTNAMAKAINDSKGNVTSAINNLKNSLPKGFVANVVPGTNRVAITTTYAQGGIVPGTSMSGDKVMIGANSGEMILNKQQQSGLFDFLKNLGTQRPSISVGNVSFGGADRTQMQQENMFMNLLVNAA